MQASFLKVSCNVGEREQPPGAGNGQFFPLNPLVTGLGGSQAYFLTNCCLQHGSLMYSPGLLRAGGHFLHILPGGLEATLLGVFAFVFPFFALRKFDQVSAPLLFCVSSLFCVSIPLFRGHVCVSLSFGVTCVSLSSF